MELEKGRTLGTIELLYGEKNAVGKGVQFMKNAASKMDIYFDYRGPSIVVELAAYRNGYREIRKRGGKIRALTTITESNVDYCKKLMKLVDELRHIDSIEGGLAVHDTEIMATTILKEEQPLTEVLYSDAKGLVRQGQYIFDLIWNNAVDGQQRIMQIEKGIAPEIIQILKEPSAVVEYAERLIQNADEEILILFSSTAAFQRQIRAGLMRQLNMLAKTKKILTRIMVLGEIPPEAKPELKYGIDSGLTKIQSILAPLQTRVSLVVVDRKFSLAVELKDDTKQTSQEAMGLGSYSNSKSTVAFYVSIFETLWKQAEFDLQQREFLNIAAHELRTPTQPILGVSELLRDNFSLDSKERVMVDIIFRNAKRLERLQSNILDVAKIDNHSFTIKKQRFDFVRLANEAIETFHQNGMLSSSPSKKLSLKLFCNRPQILVRADKQRMSEVISNLLSNAEKHTARGGIQVTLQEAGDEMTVSVQDSGSGIDPGVLPRLFTKFVTSSSRGTGMGLYISRNIVKEHGGRIWAYNNRGKSGATFSFSIPLRKRTRYRIP